MKITRDEVERLRRYFAKYEVTNQPNASWEYFARNPHLLLPMGFDEYVSLKNRSSFERLWRQSKRVWSDDRPQSVYRRPNGQWYWLMFGPMYGLKDSLDFEPKVGDDMLRIELAKLLARLDAVADTWQAEPKTLWRPELWTPDAQLGQSMLVRSARELLLALDDEKIALDELSWRQLEEIVAEILRAHGMEIHLVSDSPQGGRDIIARGELIAGQEPLTLAVEVKHRSVVGRPELQKALWQNRQYPALLFVTSGRFTSGVLDERGIADNQLRLFLKDGVALRDMIRDYRFLKR